ncbi:Gp35 OS=Streptomyces phage phiC31 GN=35 PE=4 SV=2: Peptidase_U35 [Gemmataceae bacterium]|nr:Gp35 OS=Streptomyces phage phiC31 GN=35 PE=4 SV=2: Peptidase_U35 [Gemmataceae bacterium]VTU02782.1 Gp35 OS=Streptomyces phage phiC31 GN=35 PE=4 SV=2: Peptidase_U35 [Gemmataceae bacterium]
MDPLEPIRRALPGEITRAGKLLRGLITYNSPAQIFERGKRFTEVIRPGAFRRTLAAGRDVISTFNHDVNRLLGRTASGTLRLTDSPEGLRYEVELPESAADVRELLTRGDLRGSSFFAFPHRDGGERWTRDLREVLSLELVELGPVVNPAYPTSTAEYRSAAAAPPATGHALRVAMVELMKRS